MRTQIDGPNVILKPVLAQAIAVALHELATNAAKYGALSVATGRVRVEWSCARDGRLVLRWTEAGGPPVNPPTRRGFGTHVMDAMIRGNVGGRRAARLAHCGSRVRNLPSDVQDLTNGVETAPTVGGFRRTLGE